MRKTIILICCFMLTISLSSCVKQHPITPDYAKVDIEETDNNTLDYLLNNCTTIYMQYEYHVETESSNGDYYRLKLDDKVSQFLYRSYTEQSYEERSSDYTHSKFEELRSIIISSNPAIYNINDFADENGKIIYETLNPAILIYGKENSNGPNETYLLSINDVSSIEAFFTNLKDNSDITYSETAASGSSEGYSDNESYANGTPGSDSTQNDTNIVNDDSNTTTNNEIDLGTEIVLSSTTNIRSEMNSSSAKVAVAYSGERLTVIESYDNGWSKVQYGEKEGYIRTDLLPVQ